MAELLIITDSNTAPGFRLAGVDCLVGDEELVGDRLAATLFDIAGSGSVGLIGVDDRYYRTLPEVQLKRLQKMGYPVILSLDIPRRWEEKGGGGSHIASLIRRAIGYQIKIKR